MRGARAVAALTLTAAACAWLTASAQPLRASDTPAGALQSVEPTFRSSAERVLVDVSVIRNGQPVTGLTASDFVLTDNGVTQELESVHAGGFPLSVQLILDASASVNGPRLARLIEAGDGLLTSLRSEDFAGLITFSHAVEIKTALTRDRESVRRAVAAVKGIGRTSMRDAVQLGLELPHAPGTRPLLLVFTDGHDTSSWVSDDDVVDSARRGGTVVHLVETATVWSASALPRRLAEATGGRVWSATSERDLSRLFTRALEEMRARYVLAFTPSADSAPGWHELDVRLKAGRAEIKARQRFFVPSVSRHSRRSRP